MFPQKSLGHCDHEGHCSCKDEVTGIDRPTLEPQSKDRHKATHERNGVGINRRH